MVLKWAYKYFWKCVFVLFFFINGLSAQVNSSEIISVADGLSEGMVFDIIQDKKGFIWIATKYGLNRFDGTDFVTFLQTPEVPYSLPTNQITFLYQDKKERIWLGTSEDKLVLFEPKTQRFYYANLNEGVVNDLPNNFISAIHEDDNGDIWLGSSEGQILKVELSQKLKSSLEVLEPDISSELKVISFKSKLGTDNGIYKIYSVTKYLSWALGDGYFLKIDSKKNSIEYVDIPTNEMGINDNYLFTSFLKIGNKNMFLTNNSLFELANDSPKIIRNLHFPEGHLINMDTNGDVWAIKKDSLFKVHLEQIEDIFHPSNYMSNLTKNARVTRILIDKQGNYWLGTNGFGVLKINAPQKQKASFLKNISAWQVYLDSKGNVYSWEFNMLFKSDLSGNKIKKIGSGDAQGSLIEAKNGNFWKLIRNQSKSPNIFLQHLNSDLQLIKAYDLGRGFGVPYLRILEDHNGKLIIAGFPKEIVRFDPEKERISYFDFSNEFLMGSRGVLHIYEDRAHTIWISGESGLLKIKSKADAYTFKAFSESSNSKKPFPSNYITCSVDYPADPDNYLLIGTHSSGLLKMNKKTGEFQQYTIKDGLPSNNIAGIIPETKNRVWLSSYFGIVVYDFESKLSMVYNRKDGLSSDEYNMGSFFKGKNGELVFGGINGVSIINPKMISQMKREINLKLVGFSVNNKNILPFDETGLIKESIEYLPFITLAHNENNISLKFVDLNNGAKKLKYRLLGATEKWTEVNPSSEVNYTLLPPGKYKFELANSSIDFGEEREVLSFDFEIRSPWYWNWISIMTYLLIAGWIIYMLLKNQSKQIRLNQELIFNAKEKDRLVELEELKSNFFTNVSHELKTPLTLIEGPINDLNKKYPDESLFKLIKPNIKRLRQLMYQILDVQKLEAGKVNYYIQKADIAKYFKRQVSSFESLAETYGVKIKFKQNADQFLAYFDKDKLDKIIDNLISNALKYNTKGGVVKAEVVYQENPQRLNISISDTGIGISEKDLPQIFDRFFQVKNNNIEGTGVGLSLVKELVLVLKGTINVESKENEGTTFSISLPIDKSTWDAYLMEDEVIEEIRTNTAKESQMTGDSKKELLLLVEDNPDMQEYLKFLFEDKYEIIQAFNGAEGIEKAEKEVPDLIVCDLMMPYMDGFEFSRRIRGNQASSHVPIIMLTAKNTKDSRLESHKVGIDLYVTKPFDSDELKSAISGCLENRKNLRTLFRESIVKDSSVPNLEVNPWENEFMSKLGLYLEHHYHDSSLSITVIAEELGMSETQLRRKMKSICSFSPNEYLRKFRLEKAEILLKIGEKTVSEIAFEVGYESLSYFSKRFQKKYGCLPSEYFERQK